MGKDKKVNIPKKGAAKKFAQKLKEIGEQKPSNALIDIVKTPEKEDKKIAKKYDQKRDLEL